MAAKPTNEKPDEKDQNEVETEGGFGTGLRAQLQRRREGEAPVTTELTTQKGDTPLVRLDLYASPPPAAAEAASAAADDGELHELQGELEGLREQALRLRVVVQHVGIDAEAAEGRQHALGLDERQQATAGVGTQPRHVGGQRAGRASAGAHLTRPQHPREGVPGAEPQEAEARGLDAALASRLHHRCDHHCY